MADVDLLPSRGIRTAVLVDGNGIAANGSQTVAQIAARGMRAECAVDATGVSTSGANMLQIAQRGFRAFCPVNELGIAQDASTTAATLRQRGIRPVVLLDANGIALNGSANVATLAQRGLQSFCPLDEAGNATTMGAVILISNSTVLDNATIGSNVGVLSVAGGSGTYTFTLTSNPGSLFVTAGTNGVNLNTAAALTAGDKPITVQAAGGVPTPISRSLIVTVVPSPVAPANTALPVISGSTVVGQTLTTTNGTWTGFPAPTFAYQWKRGGVAISGATVSSYLLVTADLGATITVTVTATNSAGNASATATGVGPITAAVGGTAPVNTALPAVSGTTTVGQVLTTTDGTWTGSPTPTFTYQWLRGVPDVLPANTVAPAITGSTTVGSTLTLADGTWTGVPTPTFTRQWKRNGTNISGATASTYLLVSGDLGTTISATVTATNAAGSVPANSNTTATITGAPAATWGVASPTITLSNGNLTATVNTGGGTPGVRGNTTQTTGKFYCEVHLDNGASGAGCMGLVKASADTIGNPPGFYDSNGVGCRADGLVIYQGFTTLGNVQSYATGDTICIAADLGATLIWFRTNGGNWNNSGTANPATGVGGLNFSGGGFTGPYTPKASGGGFINEAATANFGGSTYAFSVPAGFGNW